MTTIQIQIISKISKSLLKSSRWHTMILENASKASVRISSTGSEYCEIQGTGTRLQIMKLRSCFRRFYSKGRLHRSSFLNLNSSAYFAKNGTVFYCREAYSVLSKITFESYVGPRHRHHPATRLSRPLLYHGGRYSQEGYPSWRKNFVKNSSSKDFFNSLKGTPLLLLLTLTCHKTSSSTSPSILELFMR
jgi:hypothetical protein